MNGWRPIEEFYEGTGIRSTGLFHIADFYAFEEHELKEDPGAILPADNAFYGYFSVEEDGFVFAEDVDHYYVVPKEWVTLYYRGV